MTVAMNKAESLSIFGGSKSMVAMGGKGGMGDLGMMAMSGPMVASHKVYNEPPTELVTRLQSDDKGLNTVSFSPGGSVVATGGDDNFLRLWDVSSHGRDNKAFKPFLCPLSAVAWNPQG